MTKYLMLSLMLGVSGCAFIPEYQTPTVTLPDQYDTSTSNKSAAHNVSDLNAVDIAWKDFFQNPNLQQIIEWALNNNQDLKTAALNIERTRQLYQIQDNSQLPTLKATSSYNVNHASADLTTPGTPQMTRQYALSVGLVAYEIDLFGGIQSLTQSALAEYLSVEENARTPKIALIAQTATAYLWERTLAEQSMIAQQSYQDCCQAYDLSVKKFDAKMLDINTLDDQKKLCQNAHMSMIDYKRQHGVAVNALRLIVGGRLPKNYAIRSLSDHSTDVTFTPGLPSQILQNRPDIRKAEQELIAANANIGAARAAFFPKISLTTALGTASNQLSHLFASRSHTWNFMPSISVPIFDWGTNQMNLDLANIQKNIQIVAYEKAVQDAFREVSDALTNQESDTALYQQSHQILQTTQHQMQIVMQSFAARQISLINVLQQKQNVYAAQQKMLEYKYNQLASNIELYKALGGGLKN